MIGGRRKARGVALQALYELDTAGHGVDEVLTPIFAQVNLSEENRTFVRELIDGVQEHTAQIDRYIQKYAPQWPVAQLPVIDRNILRLAIFEILFDNEVAVKVAINEAVELAKRFGSENSPKFVNGVLGTISTLAGR